MLKRKPALWPRTHRGPKIAQRSDGGAHRSPISLQKTPAGRDLIWLNHAQRAKHEAISTDGTSAGPAMTLFGIRKKIGARDLHLNNSRTMRPKSDNIRNLSTSQGTELSGHDGKALPAQPPLAQAHQPSVLHRSHQAAAILMARNMAQRRKTSTVSSAPSLLATRKAKRSSILMSRGTMPGNSFRRSSISC